MPPLDVRSGRSAPSFFEEATGRAERLLLELADYVYGHTALKPMSKTLFVVSRCLLIADREGLRTVTEALQAYEQVRGQLGNAAPEDDYSLRAVLEECEPHLERIFSALREIRALTSGTDCLGLIFNALLRGKIEGGEGLGTYLTPEEVVGPMVDMAISSLALDIDAQIKAGGLFGDICGGTGRFVFTISERLQRRSLSKDQISRAARLYDQSRLAVDFARINFILQDERPVFRVVADSLTDVSVDADRGRFVLLATNPPFGSGKYHLRPRSLPWLSDDLVKPVSDTARSGAVDPALLFLVRNLDLLAEGGVLAIVLPDGIARAPMLSGLLQIFETSRSCGLDIVARVSLPASTFALGGTVAKTSFLIIRKLARPRVFPTYAAVARHVGFVKRGNRRAVDPKGNDLVRIAAAFAGPDSLVPLTSADWRSDSAPITQTPERLLSAGLCSDRLVDLAEPVRKRATDSTSSVRSFHISVLDVDNTGQINVVSAIANQPVSLGTACSTGDVIISCINPRHWRVAVVPDMPGSWSCSPEFLVLRPRSKKLLAGWELALRLHHPDVTTAARLAASGTSSSRQRVDKNALLNIAVPFITASSEKLRKHARSRVDHYEYRLREARAYEQIHEGGVHFEL